MGKIKMDCFFCPAKNLEGLVSIITDWNTGQKVHQCHECRVKATQKWQERMVIRQDASKFNCQKLINILLTQDWMHQCEIIPDYMPPYPDKDTKPTCVIRYTDFAGEVSFLRYSKGPLQGFTWDNYGDDMYSPELALVALSQAIPPVRVRTVIPTYGN